MRSTEREKPFLIWAAPPLLVLLSVTAVASAVLVALDGGAGSAEFAGAEVGRRELLIIVLPVIIGHAIMTVAGAYGLFMERIWAPSLLTKWTLVPQLVGLTLVGLRSPRLDALALESLSQFAIWYFYRYGPTLRYYERLMSR